MGRIGNWFSPWRGNASKSPNENDFSTSDCTQETEGDEESEDSVRIWPGTQQQEEESPSSLGVFRDILPREEEDATQSYHRDSTVVSSPETGGGGPREAELGACRKQRAGQGEEWEDSSSNLSAIRNPEKNVSHLSDICPASKQGGAWDFDQAPTKPHAQRRAQAQTGKRLHVYLEETSVIQCGQDTRAGQEVVCTTLKKSLKVLPKTSLSTNIDLTASSGPASEKNVSPAVGAKSYESALVGISVKPHKDLQFEPEPDKEQTEADDMGRKNASRRRQRKNSQGEGGNSPHEKKPQNANSGEEFSPTINSVAGPQGKSPHAATKEPSADSSLKHNPTLQASPEGGKSKISCPDKVKQLGNFQNASTVAVTSHESADMEEDEGLYKVERKTETPESKRRSIKVSQSEVKLFRKNVPLNQNQNNAGERQDFNAALKNITEEVNDKPKTETEMR